MNLKYKYNNLIKMRNTQNFKKINNFYIDIEIHLKLIKKRYKKCLLTDLYITTMYGFQLLLFLLDIINLKMINN